MPEKSTPKRLLLIAFAVSTLFVTPLLYESKSVTQAATSVSEVNELVSMSSAGQRGFRASSRPSISGDGRYVAFESSSPNLVPDDTNDTTDCYIRDRVTMITIRASVGAASIQADKDSSRCVISGDGKHLAFESNATNLVTADTNNTTDIFLRDLSTGAITLVSVASNGTPANNQSHYPAISENGQFVTFASVAINLVDGVGGPYNIFRHDTHTGETFLVSKSSMGEPGNHNSYDSAISADGRFTVFNSYAQNLVPNDSNGWDVFLFDAQTSVTSLISVASDGTQWYDPSGVTPSVSISSDGRYIAFHGAFGSANQTWRTSVFIRDRIAGTTTDIAVTPNGQPADSYAIYPVISADGKRVVFLSPATNLWSGDEGLYANLFVNDRVNGITNIVSRSSNCEAINGHSGPAVISSNGETVAFESNAYNVIKGDFNESTDVFVRDLRNGTDCAPVIKRPVIFVPGMGASFNLTCFVNDALTCENQDRWGWTPIPPKSSAEEYNHRLLAQFEAESYTNAADNLYFTVFHYDWRKPLAVNVPRLRDWINYIKQQTKAEKVDLVGHSEGGLVARAYIQDDIYKSQNDVAHLVTIGSPHEGLPRAYPFWEGGVLYRMEGGELMAMNILCRGCQGDAGKLQVQFPIFRDLLPTYDYVYDTENSDKIKSVGSMAEVNRTLREMNANVETLFSRVVSVTTIVGFDVATPVTMPVRNSTSEEIQKYPLNWFDGVALLDKPDVLGFEGDHTIPSRSASLRSPAKTVTFAGSSYDFEHATMPNSAVVVNAVFAALEIPIKHPLPIQQRASPQTSVAPTIIILDGTSIVTVTDVLGRVVGPYTITLPGAEYVYSLKRNATYIIVPDTITSSISISITSPITTAFALNLYKTNVTTPEVVTDTTNFWNVAKSQIQANLTAKFVVSTTGTANQTLIAITPIIETPLSYGKPIRGRAPPQHTVEILDALTRQVLGSAVSNSEGLYTIGLTKPLRLGQLILASSDGVDGPAITAEPHRTQLPIVILR